MASRLQCDFCGRVGFRDNWALRSHQARNGLCISKQRAMMRAEEEHQYQDMNIDENSIDDTSDPLQPSTNVDVDSDTEIGTEIPTEGLYSTLLDESPAKRPQEFDVTFHLVFFMRQCHNGGGLSQKDMNLLLRLLNHPEFDLRKIQLKTAAEVCKYEEALTEQRDGINWEKVEVRQEIRNAPSVHMLFRNPLTVLEELYSSPKNKEGFAICSSVITEENARLYTTLQTGEWWEEMEQDVQSSCAGGVIAPIILYSDQTSLSHNRRTQGWPLVMTLGNISSNLRSLPGGHALLAILPIVGTHDPGISETRTPSKAKLELLHKCQELILASLKEASKTGVHLKDPSGQSQWVFPRLCLYICDQTEGSKITCTYDTNKAKYPCSCCCCPRESLSDVTKRFPYRTETMMKQILEEIEECPLEHKEALAKQHSIHPLQCALWGFAGSGLSNGNPYRCIQLDGLHQSILGIFKTLVGIVRASASSFNLEARPLQELDRRILAIQKDCRYAEFRLPGNNQCGYFQSNANFHGFEHKFVMQVLVFCLLGVVPNDIIKVFVDFIEWYFIAFQSKQHSENSLNEMEKLMRKSVASMKQYMTVWQKSGFSTVKIHFMIHLKDCIKRCGLPLEYDTGLYEHLHIALMKIPYRHSNRRDFMGQVMRHNQRMKILLEEVEMQEDLRVRQEDVTALDKAVMTGQVILSGRDLNLRMDLLNCGDDSLPTDVRSLFGFQPEIQQHLKQALDDHLKGQNFTFPDNIQVWKGLAVPAGEGNRFSDWPMYTRACRSFHGRPWYGFVSVQMEAAGDSPVTWTGQLRLLFSCELFDCDSRKRIELNLAFVRLLQRLPRDDDWKTLRCEKLKWVDDVLPGVSLPTSRQKQIIRLPYMVIDVANIARVVHVVPNFTQEDTFFLNRFKL